VTAGRPRALAALALAALASVARASPPPAAAQGQDEGQGEDERASRALERTLVESGGLLLPAGRFELVPEVSYAHSDAEEVLAQDGTLLRAAARTVTGAITLRLGLPFHLQAEGEIPYVYAQQTLDAGGATASASGSGLGDARLTLTWHLVRGRERFPDVLVSGFWKTRTGRSLLDEDPAKVPLGSGIEQIGGGLALVKAIDPVVLLASVSVGESVPRHAAAGWIDPRLEVGITTSAILAVSPDTSLSFGLEQVYGQTVQVDRKDVPGSNRTAAVFDVGVATAVSRSGFLEVTLGIGLTQDVPRFQVSVATPLQF
jgi:hypothetical protein